LEVLVDIGVLHALHCLTGRSELSNGYAPDARADFHNLALVRYPCVA
jgi:hypothetical protein